MILNDILKSSYPQYPTVYKNVNKMWITKIKSQFFVNGQLLIVNN